MRRGDDGGDFLALVCAVRGIRREIWLVLERRAAVSIMREREREGSWQDYGGPTTDKKE